MLQNRVNPFGEIVRSRARGDLMGNRGVIHNERREITHVYRHKAWISCVLQFKGRRRNVMAPDRWTELFFLDEATAFAAGHRPCFECRKEDAARFKSCWISGNPAYNFTMKTPIREIDEVIHRERIDRKKEKVRHERSVDDIPEGTFIELNSKPYLFCRGRLHLWTPFGYEDELPLPTQPTFRVLTPHSIVNAFRSGYSPALRNR